MTDFLKILQEVEKMNAEDARQTIEACKNRLAWIAGYNCAKEHDKAGFPIMSTTPNERFAYWQGYHDYGSDQS